MQVKAEHKKVILTGATGVIGAGIIRRCLQKGWSVCAIVRPDSLKNKYIEKSGAKIISCDLAHLETLQNHPACKNADYFIHLGWTGTKKADRDNPDIQQKNIEYAVKACELAHVLGCSAYVFGGSQAEYGVHQGRMHPDLPVNPISEYGKAKVIASQEVKELCKLNKIRFIHARILSVYGPCNELDTMIMSTIIRLLKGEEPEFTPGEQQWDYMYSDDAAEALLLLAEKGKDGQIYCVGSGEVKALHDYINIIGKVVNPKIPLGIGKVPYAPNQIMELYADISALQRDTGFQPAVSFEEGIQRTKEWIVEHSLAEE